MSDKDKFEKVGEVTDDIQKVLDDTNSDMALEEYLKSLESKDSDLEEIDDEAMDDYTYRQKSKYEFTYLENCIKGLRYDLKDLRDSLQSVTPDSICKLPMI